MPFMKVQLQPPEIPPGRRLEDIATAEGVDRQDVDGWITSLVAHENAVRVRQTTFGGVALLLLLVGAWLVAPDALEEMGVAVGIFALGALTAAGGIVSMLLQLRVRLWQPISCRVVATAIRRYGVSWAPAVFYEYEIDGEVHRSSLVQIRGPQGPPAQANRHRQRYKPAIRYRCYYNPAQPADAVLERNLSYRDESFLFAVLGTLVMIVALFFLSRGGRPFP